MVFCLISVLYELIYEREHAVLDLFLSSEFSCKFYFPTCYLARSSKFHARLRWEWISWIWFINFPLVCAFYFLIWKP